MANKVPKDIGNPSRRCRLKTNNNKTKNWPKTFQILRSQLKSTFLNQNEQSTSSRIEEIHGQEGNWSLCILYDGLVTLIHLKLQIQLKINGGRAIEGILRGFDPFMNLVLDEAIEITKAGDKNQIGMIVLRGNSVVMLEAKDRLWKSTGLSWSVDNFWWKLPLKAFCPIFLSFCNKKHVIEELLWPSSFNFICFQFFVKSS